MKKGSFRLVVSLFYIVFVFALSSLTTTDHNPTEYKTVVLYYLNLVLVHAGWLLSSATIFMLLISNRMLSSPRPEWPLGFDVAYLIAATVYWFVLTRAFVLVANNYGSCSIVAKTRSACVQNGGEWTGFDVSGHCFLIVLASSLIMEELYDSFAKINPIASESGSPSRTRHQKHRWLMFSTFLKGWSILVLVLWCLLLAQTSVFFHIFAEKALGCLLGLLFWPILSIVKRARSFSQS